MSDSRKLPTTGATTGVPTSVPLGGSASIDLSWLPEDKRRELLTEYTRGILDISRRAAELNMDANALRNTLDTLSDSTSKIADKGLSVTASGVHNMTAGRIEVIVGNTKAAGEGKLSKSQTGERDWTPIYVIAGLVALVLIAMSLGRH